MNVNRKKYFPFNFGSRNSRNNKNGINQQNNNHQQQLLDNLSFSRYRVINRRRPYHEQCSGLLKGGKSIKLMENYGIKEVWKTYWLIRRTD